MKVLIHNIFKRSLLISSCAVVAVSTGLSSPAYAAPTYNINKVLVAEDQYQGEAGVKPKPVYKPHEVAVHSFRGLWVSSNERTGFAGITVFRTGSNGVLATLNIEEPDVEFAEEAEEEEHEELGHVEGEEEEVENFEPEVRFNPEVCLPVRLYPGSMAPVFEDPDTIEVFELPVWNGNTDYVCAPLGAEMHPRHPHGIDIDKIRQQVFQVIEHSGLKWNADRTGLEIAENTDEESGLLLVYDIRNKRNPRIVDGFLLGHGAHEVAVNELNGKAFQGNHEDSPGVEPTIWVDVIDRNANNPYGFIDTGFYNAIQGIEVNELQNQVFGTTHVGEKMFAFKGNCVPTANADPDAEKAMGENCILYSVDLREPFFEQIPEAEEIFEIADTEITEAEEAGEEPTVLPSVLHMHDLTVDRIRKVAYQTVHSIHHAEHTGSPEEAALPDPVEETHPPEEEPLPGEEPPPVEEEEPDHHFMGRWVAEVNVNPWSSGFKQVTYIDLSNGQNILAVPNVEDIAEGTPFEDQFVHAHWVAVDPWRDAVLVTGEHTGNLGVVDRYSRELEQVIGISRTIPDCVPPLDEEGNPEVAEPHVHGVQYNKLTGSVYVSDEGEHCFYEAVTILKPTGDNDDDDDDDDD